MPIIATASTTSAALSRPRPPGRRLCAAGDARHARPPLRLCVRREGRLSARSSPLICCPHHMNLAGISIRAVDQPHGEITSAGLRFDAGGSRDRLFHRFRQLDRRHGDAVRRAGPVGGRCAAAQAAPDPPASRPDAGMDPPARAQARRCSPIWTTAWTIAPCAPSCPTGSSPAMTGWKSSCERRRSGR